MTIIHDDQRHCKTGFSLAQVENEDEEFVEEFLSRTDPSILHFLLASGDQITSKQLRDDLMTLLIAGSHPEPKETHINDMLYFLMWRPNFPCSAPQIPL